MLSRLLIAATLAAFATQVFATQALAEPRHSGRYDVERLHGRPGGKVLILDRKTGQIWTWSEQSMAVYSGQVFPLQSNGSFARIIHVPQDKR